MNVELKPGLEDRLRAIAKKRSQSLSELVEERMLSYFNVLESESPAWVESTQSLLHRVWPAEDFREWNSPDA
jgi:hypothetical protein